ncbi:MAG: hypothetical protein HFJ80_04570 [Clostridiales bacterium]|nr:hypothetical protein [Clostridiales bacterium]
MVGFMAMPPTGDTVSSELSPADRCQPVRSIVWFQFYDNPSEEYVNPISA